MAARSLLGNLSRPSHLPFLCRSASALGEAGGHRSSGPPLARAQSGLNYYKNMHDSLLEIYTASGSAEEGPMSVTRFLNDLMATGLKSDDPRLKSTLDRLQAEADAGLISQPAFMDAVSSNMPLIESALRDKFIIPEFGNFTDKIDELYHECQRVTGGRTADYIPELARVDKNQWGVSLCTVNGQRHSIGDSSSIFTMQSGSKCFTYALAVEEYDAKTIHEHIGKEPSGQSFNSLFLNLEGKPHNPMINAGAMSLFTMIRPQDSITARTNFILEKFCEMAGVPNRSLKCDIMTCDSEMETAHRNYALLHYMKDMKVLSEDTDIEEILKLYTRICSVEMDCERGAVMAATLANSGQCPITGTKVLSTDTICYTLSLMHSCGMYDSAGEFSFSVGLPAKSGISGVIFVVVPNVMGLCLYSPLVNKNGNSLKGLAFCEKLVETFNFHSYDSLMPQSKKIDPRRKRADLRELEVTSVMYAAQAGALSTLQRYKMSGMDLSLCNYDGRTPLHVAAAEGHYKVVEMLLEHYSNSVNITDRWCHTPLDEAVAFGHPKVAALLRDRGGVRGSLREDLHSSKSIS